LFCLGKEGRRFGILRGELLKAKYHVQIKWFQGILENKRKFSSFTNNMLQIEGRGKKAFQLLGPYRYHLPQWHTILHTLGCQTGNSVSQCIEMPANSSTHLHNFSAIPLPEGTT
jgi:hypothetical protein